MATDLRNASTKQCTSNSANIITSSANSPDLLIYEKPALSRHVGLRGFMTRHDVSRLHKVPWFPSGRIHSCGHSQGPTLPRLHSAKLRPRADRSPMIVNSSHSTNSGQASLRNYVCNINWDSNDSVWSVFIIRVGTSAQFFRVLSSISETGIWIPISDICNASFSWCGNVPSVNPFNAAGGSSFSGTRSDITASIVDAGPTSTVNKSSMCFDCLFINGRCTYNPCSGRSV